MPEPQEVRQALVASEALSLLTPAPLWKSTKQAEVPHIWDDYVHEFGISILCSIWFDISIENVQRRQSRKNTQYGIDGIFICQLQMHIFITDGYLLIGVLLNSLTHCNRNKGWISSDNVPHAARSQLLMYCCCRMY